MDWPAATAVIAVGVNLDDQGHPLHTLLWGEVGAQAVDGDEDLQKESKIWKSIAD